MQVRDELLPLVRLADLFNIPNAAANPDEILVSALTRTLAGAAGFAFEDRGTHELKGLDGQWPLAALVEGAS